MKAFPRGIFSRPRHAWLALFAYILLLYASLTLVFRTYIWVFDRIGRDAMSLTLNSAYVAAGLVLLAFAARRGRGGAGAYATLVLIVAVAAFCLKMEDVPANRLHLMQYAPLAILALEALRTRFSGFRLYAGVLVFVLLAGCGDEAIQSFSPHRRFDPRDLGLNMTAGALALLFVVFVLGPENYPWGRRAERRRR